MAGVVLTVSCERAEQIEGNQIAIENLWGINH